MKLLDDDNIYEKINKQKFIKERWKCRNETKKLLKNDDYFWVKLIEHRPKTPTFYGLLTIHKPDTPIKPIIAGIGSDPHKLSSTLTKILTSLFGIISSSDIKKKPSL